MTELINKVHKLIDKYNSDFSKKGMTIISAKKYFETNVYSSHSHYKSILDIILHGIKEKREKTKYLYKKNKYHIVTITVIPLDKNVVPKSECKDYAFVIKKTERLEIGKKPIHTDYKEEKVLSKIENRLLKILKQADNTPIKTICRDNFLDIIRYSTRIKYQYKKRILGKNALMLQTMVDIGITIIFLLTLFICWLVFK